MTVKKVTIIAPLLFLIFHLGIHAQTNDVLPRSTPEAEGVSSQGILEFIEAVGKSKHEMHSFMLLRHGKVVAEGWWPPYRPDLKHTMYSVSKSFTATAIGFAVSEKRLTVEDKVISFFPNDLPPTMPPYLAELRVRDLLSMSVGQDPDPTGPVVSRDSNWIKGFLARPVLHPPGTIFLYNSLATYALSAIVQKVTGEKVIDYLSPRLFAPLGIRDMDWETDLMGINTGGWGLRLKTEDMARFGQLFLQKGQWKGRQVLPAAWVEEASTLKIVQHPAWPQAKKDSSDWEQGYCYQMWRCRNNAFRADGAFGQFIVVMPDQDAVLVITSETSDMQAEFNLVWQYLFPAIQQGRLPANKKNTALLQRKLAALALPLPVKNTVSPLVRDISGKTFALSPNDKYVQALSFQFKDNVCQLAIKLDSSSYQVAFGAGKWVNGATTRRGPYLVTGAKNYLTGLPAFQVAGSYAWKGDSTLELTLRYIESPHTETFTCRFGKNNVSVEVRNSFNKSKTSLQGISSPTLPKPIRLIVRGDDMGFSHSANEALIKAYREGIETSIEVLVPSPWFPEAVKMLTENPGVDVGIHLALTSEWDNVKWRPLSDCPSLKNADGYFYPMVYAHKNYPGQSILENNWQIADVEREFRAQIEMALKKLPRVSHLSAHMNCTNMSEEVKALTKKLAREYRIPVEPDTEYRDYVTYAGPHKTAVEKKQSFLAMLRTLKPGQTYVFVDHPGLEGAELQAIHHVGYEDVAADRQGVTDLFTDADIKTFIRQNGIALIGYKDLVEGKE